MQGQKKLSRFFLKNCQNYDNDRLELKHIIAFRYSFWSVSSENKGLYSNKFDKN